MRHQTPRKHKKAEEKRRKTAGKGAGAEEGGPNPGGFKGKLAHVNCTLFCAPNAQKRTDWQQGKKTSFLDVL